MSKVTIQWSRYELSDVIEFENAVVEWGEHGENTVTIRDAEGEYTFVLYAVVSVDVVP